MPTQKELMYEKRGKILVKNLQSRHFDAVYCATREEALKKALEWIPEGATVGWGGAMTAQQIGLIDAVNSGPYAAMDRANCATPEEREAMMHKHLTSDVFLTGANGMSLDGQMVNIDGLGNRVSAIIYGSKTVVVIAGMNKVMDTVEAAVQRARTVAAPINVQRLQKETPCAKTGLCYDCKHEDSICNHIVITRHSRPAGRIQFVLVGEDLGF